MRILIVDSDARGREVLVQRMRSRGFDMDSAGTAAEAIDLMTAAKYDYVFVELVMPHNAFAAISSWMGRVTAPPRIVVTSGVAELWRRANPNANVAGILQKPFTIEDVVRVVGSPQGTVKVHFKTTRPAKKVGSHNDA
jgi:DNA-binding response OmpR family regulator